MKYGKILVTLFVAAAANSLAAWFEPRDGTFSPDGSKFAYFSNYVSWGCTVRPEIRMFCVHKTSSEIL